MSEYQPSLTVFLDGQVIFRSYGKWLHPLFDLEDYLKQHPADMKRAILHDKVIGKAAAFLIVKLSVGHVHGQIVSKLAMQVFDLWRRPCSFDQLVDQIACQTESILVNIDDPDEAYSILCKRAKRY